MVLITRLLMSMLSDRLSLRLVSCGGAMVAADAVSTLIEGVHWASEIVYRSEAALQKLRSLAETTQRLAAVAG